MTDRVLGIFIRIVSLFLWILLVVVITRVLRCRKDDEQRESFASGVEVTDSGTNVETDESTKDTIERKKLELQRKKDEAELRSIQAQIDAEDKKKEAELKKKEAEAEAEKKKNEAEKEAEKKKKEAEKGKDELGDKAKDTASADNLKASSGRDGGGGLFGGRDSSSKDNSPDGLLQRVFDIRQNFEKQKKQLQDLVAYAKSIQSELMINWYRAKTRAVSPPTPPSSNVSTPPAATIEKFEVALPGVYNVNYDQVAAALTTVPYEEIKKLEDTTRSVLGQLSEPYQFYRLMMDEERKSQPPAAPTSAVPSAPSASSSAVPSATAPSTQPAREGFSGSMGKNKVNEMIMVIEQQENSLDAIERNIYIANAQLTELNTYYKNQKLIASSRMK